MTTTTSAAHTGGFATVVSQSVYTLPTNQQHMFFLMYRGGTTNSIMGVHNSEFASEASEKIFLFPPIRISWGYTVLVMHNYAVNRKFKCLQYQLARMIAVPFARTKIRLVIQMSVSVEIATFHWTTGHIRVTLPQKVVVTRFRFRRGLMDRGGESCKGVAVVEVIRPNIWK